MWEAFSTSPIYSMVILYTAAFSLDSLLKLWAYSSAGVVYRFIYFIWFASWLAFPIINIISIAIFAFYASTIDSVEAFLTAASSINFFFCLWANHKATVVAWYINLIWTAFRFAFSFSRVIFLIILAFLALSI